MMRTWKWIILMLVPFVGAGCGEPDRTGGAVDTIADTSNGNTNSSRIPLFDSAAQVALEVHDIFEDRSGNFWFALNSFGVCRYNPSADSFSYFREQDGLISNHAGLIQEDEAGNIWIGTAFGICRFDPVKEKFVSFTDKDQQPLQIALEPGAVAQSHYFWFGANSGAYRCDGVSLQYFTMPLKSGDPFVAGKYPKQANGYTVYATLQDQQGEYWFATTAAGIARYNGTTMIYYQTGQIDGVPRCIFEDHTGKIWVGSNGGGVSYYNGTNWVNFCAERGLGNDHSTSNMKDPLRKLNRVWSIAEDHAGNIWFGTIDEGVWMYDAKAETMKNYSMKDGLTSDSVWKVFCDREGKVWFGTDGGGVCTFDGARITNFTRTTAAKNNATE